MRTRIFAVVASVFVTIFSGCSEPAGPPSYTIQVNAPSVPLTLGGTSATAIVTATVTENNKVNTTVPLSWRSSDASVASVTSTGHTATIIGRGHGSATITATVGDKSATTNVTVTAPNCVFNSPQDILVTPGTPLSGTLDRSDCRLNDAPAELYRFAISTAQIVTISVRSFVFGPRVAIFGGNPLTELASSAAPTGTTGNTILIRRLAPGTYYIAAGAVQQQLTERISDSGAYSLSVTTATPNALCSASDAISTITPTAAVTSISGSLSTTDCQRLDGAFADVYRLSVTGTANVRINLASSAFDAFLILTDADFINIASADDGGDGGEYTNDAQLSRSLSPGTYYIVAGANKIGQLGSYTLTVRSP